MAHNILRILVLYGKASNRASSALSKAMKAAEEFRELGISADVIPVISRDAGRRPIIYVHGLVFEDHEKLQAGDIVRAVIEAISELEDHTMGFVSAAAVFLKG